MAERTRKASGREPHDAKITTYLTASELLLLDHSILEMRRVYGIKVDRGRYVREALAAVSFRTIAEQVRQG